VVMTCAVAVAPLPPPPLKLTDGAVEYPLPPLVSVIDVTPIVPIVACPVGFVADRPEPPVMITVGVDVYPLPCEAMAMDAMRRPTVAETVKLLQSSECVPFVNTSVVSKLAL